MTALGKLLRTTAFRLTLVYLSIFALFAAALLGYFALNTRRMINEQIVRTLDSEIADLTRQFDIGGLRGLLVAVDTRAGHPGSNLYLVTTRSGDGLVGNVGSLEPGVIERTGLMETAYRRIDDPDTEDRRALVRVLGLSGGFRLLVGRDLEERERLFSIVAIAGRWSVAVVIVLGIIGGIFVSRRVLRRIDAMSDKAQTIMAGDLTGRLPIAGSGDELDRLSANLNAMLERIETLMRGLKQVSDNVAHDLRTPLTRLRNRGEAALRSAKGESDYREAIEATIEESDALIRVFDALLMIARAESGEPRGGMETFDAAEIARDLGELYEPVAEEKGLALRVDAARTAPVKGNRELIGQALANLLDNAIKYAGSAGDKADGDSTVPDIAVTAETRADRVILSVADRGPGIPAADRARAIERFVRLEQSRTQPGSGLGLSLASAVAQLHGGELRLEDNDPGLRAILLLPRAETLQKAT
ncbi:MAG: ATP-binding protein [Xanthobacteraceae bacterium]